MVVGRVWKTGRRGLIVALGAVISLIVAGAIFLVVRGGSQPAYVGYRWELVRLVRGGEVLPLPEQSRATMTYSPGDEFSMNDTVNYTNGKIAPSGSGYAISSAYGTEMHYGGKDPRVPVLEEAMRPLGAVGVDRAEVRGGQLVLQAGTYTFTFDNAGPARQK